jgi:hypothetical protein
MLLHFHDLLSATSASGQPGQARLLWDAVLTRMQEWFCGSDPMPWALK